MNQIFTTLVTLFALTFSFHVIAQEAPKSLFRLEYNSDKTSDKLERSEIKVYSLLPRTDLSWPYTDEFQNSNHLGIDLQAYARSTESVKINGQRAAGVFGKKYSQDLYLEALAGIHSVKSEEPTLAQTVFNYELKIQSWLADNLFIQVTTIKDLIYQELVTAQVDEKLSYNEVNPLIIYTPIKEVRIINRDKFRILSDKNKKQEFDLAAMYGLYTSTPWVWVGMGYNQINFSKEKNQVGYWAPEKFKAYGLRAEMNVPVNNELPLQLIFNAVYNHQQEENFEWGEGSIINVGFNYGDRAAQKFSMAYNEIRSRQSNSQWVQATWNLQYQESF